jgi:hypothetical protein
VEALRKTLREAENEAPRVSAAKTILELGLKSVELGQLEERIARLEQLAKNNWRPDDHHPDHAQVGTTRRTNARVNCHSAYSSSAT